MNKTVRGVPPAGVSVTLVRRLPVPTARAFATWTEPRLMAKWLAAGADVVTSITSDLRDGGKFRVDGRHAEGAPYSVTGTYLSVVEPTRVRMSWSYDGPVTALKGAPSIVTAEFTALDASTTELTLTHDRCVDREAAETNRVNWLTCLDKLDAVVAQEPNEPDVEEPGPQEGRPEDLHPREPHPHEGLERQTERRDFFSPGHRAIQDHFSTRKLADRLEASLVHDHLKAADAAFITRQNMFFLATADAYGQPNCSYKGGTKGFVTVIDDHSLAYPDYDGNGMHISAGNINETRKVGLLFVDFEAQARMRVLGSASISDNDRLLKRYPGARMVVRVKVESVFSNCPRYVHRLKLVEESVFVPDAAGNSPVPEWKLLHGVADVLTDDDKSVAGTATDLNKTLNRDS